MIILLTILQFVIVVIICIAVLLQKSSSIGFGVCSGSNESLFGVKGSVGSLVKFTFIMGILLIVNTIGLGYLYNSISKDFLAGKIKAEADTSIPTAPDAINVPAILSAPQIPSESNTSK